MMILWGIELTSIRVLSRISEFFYDLSSATIASFNESTPNIVILEVNDPDLDWREIIKNLHLLETKSLNFSFSTPLLQNLRSNKEQKPITLSKAWDEQDFPENTYTSIYLSTPDFDGITRHHPSHINKNNQLYFTLEGKSTQATTPLKARIYPFLNPLLVPILTLEDALKTTPGKELIKSKHLFITLKEQGHTKIRLPQSLLSGQNFDERVFHALSFYSLNEQKNIRHLNDLYTFPISIFLSLLFIFGLRIVGLRVGLFYATIYLLFIVALQISLLVFLSIHFPAASLFITTGLAYLHFSRSQWHEQQKVLGQILLRQSSYLSKKLSPMSSLDNQEAWQQMADLSRHLLNFKRAIFLEKIEGDHRLKEVVSVDISIEAIKEPRRDYKRSPYKDAIQKGSSIEVKKYLKEDPALKNEVQYLCPLMYDGEIIGFWALGIEKDQLKKNVSFEDILNDLSSQLAKLLRQRGNLLKNNRHKKVSWKEWFSGGQDKAIRELRSSIQMLIEKNQSSELQLESLSTSTITYNVFGRVEQVNQQMREVLSQFDFKVFEMTLLDFIVKLTNQKTEDARSLIREVIMEQKAIFLPASTLKNFGQAYQLYLIPLLIEKENSSANTPAFKVNGILCELIDLSDVKSIVKLKDVLFERLYYKLKNDLELYTLSAEMLEQELPPEELVEVGALIQEKVKESSETLDQTKTTLLRDIISTPVGCFPIRVNEPLDIVSKKFEKLPNTAGISLHIDSSELLSLVQASPKDLIEILNTCLKVLLDDATDDSAILVSLQENMDETVTYTLSNVGIGMPPERFKACISGKEARTSKEFRKLQEAHDTLKSWGGHLTGKSQLGDGITFYLSLKTII